jgi:hypothetical protein
MLGAARRGETECGGARARSWHRVLQVRASQAQVSALVGFAGGAHNAQWASSLGPLQTTAYYVDRRYVR